MRAVAVLVLLLALSGCGNRSAPAGPPSGSTPPPPTAPSTRPLSTLDTQLCGELDAAIAKAQKGIAEEEAKGRPWPITRAAVAVVLYGSAAVVYGGLKGAAEADTAIVAAANKLGAAMNDLAKTYQGAASKPDTGQLDTAIAEVRAACRRG
ncbi:hypothetical protein Val02_09300 [Virgisporangium aliadipatigenens]|uniref:Uncharacterized protein n=1 Tax=Virgisporangium aliadipatigenens TaxID=741659 RepID=A0A8J3YF73_9ACTN|nr:hypothetical protein [Virgisporangium aliadipatigenens]GIJ44044.1 hypothetical protein Val02_09300 [Virgisporangium aliadipatigenens]